MQKQSLQLTNGAETLPWADYKMFLIVTSIVPSASKQGLMLECNF